MRVLFIAPHLSTGGMPQYLLRKIENLITHGISMMVVEYSDISGTAFVVQKNKIKSLVPIRTLYGDKDELLAIIEEFEPTVIHFEEIPEYFMDHKLASNIYTNKKYKIIETTHDSSFNVHNKVFFPDEFLFVSNYSIKQFESLGIPSKLAEYPVLMQKRPNRNEALSRLGLNPEIVHILNVGLFTPRKNQKEMIDYARKMTHLPVQFHFVGNQAGNFEYYWKNLMDNLPENCVVWGERNDVDLFYSSMDLFLFTSRGFDNDKETNPLSIKEALAWNMPLFIYNLPVYLNKYDYVENITYLADDMNTNVNLIEKFIQLKLMTLKASEYENNTR